MFRDFLSMTNILIFIKKVALILFCLIIKPVLNCFGFKGFGLCCVYLENLASRNPEKLTQRLSRFACDLLFVNDKLLVTVILFC